MARPPKYKTPKDAVEAAVLMRVGKFSGDMHWEHVLWIASYNCHICGTKPLETYEVNRKDGYYSMSYNRIQGDKAICKMCVALTKIATIKEVRSYAARILAKRKHDLDLAWVTEPYCKLMAESGGTD